MVFVGTANALPALTDYSSVTSLTYNITASMGAQTNYQTKFILSNASGVSGYYAPDNVIFTNGTTRPDWNDVNATDGSNTPLSFWIENNTQTAKNATAWVRAPVIAIDNTSTAKWYYGNSSQTESSMSGLNTFPYFEDYTSNTLNTTQTLLDNPGGGGSVTLSNGVATIVGSSISRERLKSVTLYGLNYSVRSRLNVNTESGTIVFNHGFVDDPFTNLVFFENTPTASKYVATMKTGTATEVTRAGGLTSYSIAETSRYASGTPTANFSINGVLQNTVNTNIPTVSMNTTTAAIHNILTINQDWIVVRKSVYPEPITSSYTTSNTVPAPTASFTCAPTSTTLGNSISCTDASTNTPTNWSWSFGDGNTSILQNPTYTYPFTGTFTINMSANNTVGIDWENKTNYIVVTNATNFHQQDIYLTGQYLITFLITSSTTSLPIANTTVVDSVSGQSYPSTNGTAFLTLPAGLYYVNFIADGYQSRQITYVVDKAETHTVQLTPSVPSPSPNTNTIYVPRLVRLRAVDNWRTPLYPVNISASYIADTLPNHDREYLQSAFGISSSVVDLMLDSSIAMSGTTGVDGSNTFSMFPALTYNLTITNETLGVHCQQNLAPADTDYVLFCPTDAQKAAAVPLSQTLNRSYIWVTEPNASFVTINASYQDLTGLTSSVLFNVSVVDNNTVIYSKNFGNPGTSQVLDNYTMPNIRGMQITSYLAYNRSTS